MTPQPGRPRLLDPSISGLRRFLVFSMNALGFLSLYLSGEIAVLSGVLFGLALAGGWFWRAPRVNFARWQTPWTVVTMLAFAATIVRMFTAEEFDLTSAVYFVVFLTGAKLFQLAEHKDYPQSMALSLLLLASGSAMNEQLSFGMMFAAYVIAATLALTVQHLNVEVSERGADIRTTRMERAIFWSTVGLSIAVFVGSLAFFFVFPRVGFGFFVQQNRSGIMTSGFGEDVELGGHGTVREDATIVMRVKFPDGPPEPVQGIYFRGLSLDLYTGHGWRDTDDTGRGTGVRHQPGNPGYLITPYTESTWEDATAGTVIANYYLEPIATDILFGIGLPHAIGLPDDVTDLPEHLFGRTLRADATGQVTLGQRGSVGTQYRMWSARNIPYLGTGTSIVDGLRAERYPGGFERLRDAVSAAYARVVAGDGREVRPNVNPLSEDVRSELERNGSASDRALWSLGSHYLQLPPDQVSDEIAALVQRLRVDAPTDVDFALAVENHLRAMEYTTDLPMPTGDASLVDQFLFDWQRGHCEYFATAMVVLLRAGGTPARIVNGFYGGDYNPVGDFYNVRQANAHSWVEVYFPESGWVRFDPTPSGAPDVAGSGPLWKLQMFIDNLRLHWFRWVVEYDLEKQVNLVRDAVEAVQGDDAEPNLFTANFGEWVQDAFRWIWRRAAAITLLVLCWFTAAGAFHRRSRERIPWSGVDWAVAVGWLVVASLVYLRFWPSDAMISGALGAYVPIAITVFLAREVRADLFDVGDGRGGRSRGGDFVSGLYARLLATVERETGDLPLSITAAELLPELDLEDAALAAEVRKFLQLYQRVRFAGASLRPEDEAGWRRRFRRLRRGVARDLRRQMRA